MSILKMIDRLIKAGYPEGTAKKIASGELPMSDTSRFPRAGEQSTDTSRELFHWTNRDFNEFQPSSGGKFGQGVYLSPRPYYGEKYVERGDPRRMSVYGPSNIAKRDDINSVEKSVLAEMKEQNVPPMAMGDTFWNMVQGKLKEKGFDALEFGDEVVVFDPARVRDVRAAFDPDNIGKPNILGSAASVAAGGVLAALGMSPEEAEAGVFPYAFKMAEDALERGSSLFTEKALKSAARDASGNSRTAITMMSPDEFLRVVPTPENSISQKNVDKIAEHIKSGGKLDDVPFLVVNMDDKMNMPRYSGHEGRHRALALKQLGIEEMPVRIKMGDDMGIRWDELHSRNPLRNKSLPEQVLHEGKGNTSSAFPIKKTPTGFETARNVTATGGILGALGAVQPGQAEASPRTMRKVSEAIQANPNEGMIAPNDILDALMGFLAPQTMGDATMDAYNRRRIR